MAVTYHGRGRGEGGRSDGKLIKDGWVGGWVVQEGAGWWVKASQWMGAWVSLGKGVCGRVSLGKR